jgi:DNA-binding PadR family transcriptional regulator
MGSHEMTHNLPPHVGWLLAKGKGRGRGRYPRQEQLERMAALRGMGGPGFGGPMFGHPFGGGRGRKRRGDVRVALLLLLGEAPRNGYQLMQEIEQRSGGRWRLSPGSVYPTLAQLEDEGLIRSAERDGTKLFELTDAGRTHLDERTDTTAPWEGADDPGAEAFVDMRALLVQVAKAAWEVAQVGDERQIAQGSEILSEARRSLYRVLAEEGDA